LGATLEEEKVRESSSSRRTPLSLRTMNWFSANEKIDETDWLLDQWLVHREETASLYT